MSKKLNRKKQLRNGLRRAGAFSSTVTKVVDETKKSREACRTVSKRSW
ncbi:Helicase [Streptococcus pneumoniae]|nr:Helicase [Streptococcus pneumoniae]VLV44595.1 Helicase [Streptococcus pneumoniae]HEW6530832.1 hypothetical protein [Streptococcus pneumoniae]